MQGKEKAFPFPMDPIGDRENLQRIAKSEQVQKLMAMLQQQGSVEEAAKAAAAGDSGRLIGMMDQLIHTKEGAQLVENIKTQVKKAGLS